MRKNFFSKFLLLTFFLMGLSVVLLNRSYYVWAIECASLPKGLSEDEYTNMIIACEAAKKKTEQDLSDLQKAISSMTLQETTTRNKINQTITQINVLEGEIATLSAKIVRLNTSLDYISEIFISRINFTYKMGRVNSFSMLFSSKNIGEFLAKYKYLKVVQLRDRDLLLSMEETKVNYDEQKQTKEQLQAKLLVLKKQLDVQKVSLVSQIASRKKLLEETKGKQTVYERLRNEANAELASLRGFTSSHEGGFLPPQQSPDGWYYSQRDERWANLRIGNSNEIIYDVGCLVASVAMIFTHYGQKATPADIANNSSYFSVNTAYMSSPWPVPSGKSQTTLNNLLAVDSELNEGRPVIVHLNIGGDGHFVVLKKKEGENYIMHDPWFGYDKNFKDYYTLSMIDKRVSYR